MNFLDRLLDKIHKFTASNKVHASREKQLSDNFKTFILEPILTPSALIDGGEEMPDPTMLDGQDLPWLAALDEIAPAADDPPEIFTSGTFEVGALGEVEFEFLYDGGGYEGELAIFSLEGMEEYEPGSREFIQEAARRSLSDSEWGRIVIADRDEGAKFEGDFGEWNFNQGEYAGTKTFQMRPGDRFGAMLVPEGEVAEVFDNPDIGGAKRPLFSLSTANPDDGLQAGQIADVDGNGQTFVFEDLRVDGNSDRDYNDIIFRVKGAEGEAVELDEVIAADRDWRETELGQEILDYVKVDEPLPVAGDGGEILILSDRPDWSEVVTEAVNQTAEELWEFAHQPDFSEKVQLTFGENVEVEAAREAIVELVAGRDFPPIQILTQGELGEANAGFGIESKTIYLSHSFIESHLENPEIVSRVLLEELGHFLDVKLETEDAPGDEGAIFASLATGGELETAQLIALQGESDRATIAVNGENITVEQNGTGLKGYYYHDADFGKLAYERIETPTDLNWGEAPWGVAPNGHSIRWTGLIAPPDTKTYNFTTRADGRTRVWIKDDGGTWRKVVEGWDEDTGGSRDRSGGISLIGGRQYEIKIEYQDDTGNSNFQLLWDGHSPTLETIPPQYFTPAEPSQPAGVEADGTGLKAREYREQDFSSLRHEYNAVSQLNYDWGATGPWETSPDGHSSLWTGRIEAPTSETYQLRTHADGRTRVWLEDDGGTWHKVVEGWDEDTGAGTRERFGTMPFPFVAGNEYKIKVEYQDDAGDSNIELLWESPTQTRQVVPSRYLHPGEVSETGEGTGVHARYYSELDFSQAKEAFHEPQADRDWEAGSPNNWTIQGDNWSGIWTAQVEAPSSDTYQFFTRADGKVRLWWRHPDGEWQRLIDAWENDPNTSQLEASSSVFMEAGQKYDIKVEFQEEAGEADLELLWENSTQTRRVIENQYLYPVQPEAPGTGVTHRYFPNTNLEGGQYWEGVSPSIDFEWGQDSVNNWAVPPDGWSIRFNGQLEAPYSEEFKLMTRANGGTRVWIRDPEAGVWHQLIENWSDSNSSVERSATIPFPLEAGQKYDIQVEYKDETGDAQLKLLWESPSQTLAAIPPQFFSAEKPETPVGVAGNGTGLKGTYYNNSDFTNLVLERKDGEIDFDWGVGSPDAVMEPDSFSVRWTGEIEPRYTNEDYRFYLQNDDGARLWLDGELIVDNWDNPAPERASQPLSLEAGRKYDIQLEYREEVGEAGVQLLWSSREQEKETIPASQLFGEDPADCTPIAVGWSQTLDIAQPGAYTFDIDLPFGTTFTVNGETFDTTPEDNSFSLLLPAGAIDFQLQMPAISPCAPPWSDTPENEGGPEIELGITFPTGERRRGYIEGGWLTNAGPGGGTGGDDGGWWDIDWPSWEPVDPGTNEPPPASGEEPPGTGLYAQYFKGTTFSNLAYAKFVPNVYEDWDYKGPLWDDSHLEDEVRLNVEADNFGVRYTGQIKAIEDGEYKFSFKELDGKARLWVNGQLVMDGEGHGTPPDANGNGIADDFYYGDVSQSISLEAGQKYNFQLDFVDPGGEASALLHWEKDGGAPATIWNSLLYPTMPPGMLLVNDEPTPVLVGKSSAAASLLSQYFYDDYESVNVTVRDRSPNESAAFLNSPAGDVLWSGTLSKSEVLGTSSYLEIAQKNYEEMFGEGLPERDRLYGTHLAVEYELLDENGNGVLIDNRAPGRFSDNFYVYRWIDAVGATEAFKEQGAIAAFHEKSDSGLGKVQKTKEVDLFLPTSTDTVLTTNNDVFTIPEVVKGTKTVEWQLNPTDLGLVGDTIGLKAGNTKVGAIVAQAQIDPNKIGHLIVDNNANPIVISTSQTIQDAINDTSTYDNLQIVIESLDNRFDDFLKQPITGNTSQQLWSGNLTSFQQTFVQNGLAVQNFNEMFNPLPNGYQGLTKDQLYGTRVRVKYEFKKGSQTKIATDDHYIYRWVNAHNPGTHLLANNQQTPNYSQNILFHRTFADGQGGFQREKEIELFLPQGVETKLIKAQPSPELPDILENPDFAFLNSIPDEPDKLVATGSNAILTFDPDPANANSILSETRSQHYQHIQIQADGVNVGFLLAQGLGTKPVTVNLEEQNFKDSMKTLLSNYVNRNSTEWGGQSVYYYGQPLYEDNALYVASQRFVNDYQPFIGVDLNSLSSNTQLDTKLDEEFKALWDEFNEDFVMPINNFAQSVTNIAPLTLIPPNPNSNSNQPKDFDIRWDTIGLAGQDNAGLTRIDRAENSLKAMLGDSNSTEVAKFWALSEFINQFPLQPSPLELMQINLPVIAAFYGQSNDNSNPNNLQTTFHDFPGDYGNLVAEAVSHELAHLFGVNDAYETVTTGKATSVDPEDLMGAFGENGEDRAFDSQHLDIILAAMGLHTPESQNSNFKAALDLYKTNFNLPDDLEGIQDNP